MTYFVILFASSFMFASCFDTDEEEYSFYGDAAVSAFSLGTMNQYLYTKDSNGEDSLYKETYTGSDYTFYIDNVNGKIYNPDSLPYGTDAAHVIANITAKNGGFVVLKAVDSDNLEDYTYYVSTDSIDFSVPRSIRVYSQSGENYRDYAVTVNVHREYGDSLKWHEAPQHTAFARLAAMRCVACGDNIFLLGNDGGATSVYTINRLTGTEWGGCGVTFGADAYANAVVKDGQVYLLDGGVLYSSADGQDWTQAAAVSGPDRLVGASSAEMYGLGNGGRLMVSRDNGVTWQEDEIDDWPAPVPDADINYTCRPLQTNDGVERVMLAGRNSGSGEVAVWTKIVDSSGQNQKSYPWTYVDAAGGNRYTLPALGGLTILDYDGNALAFGKETSSALSGFLVSRDDGITWKSDGTYYYPADFAGSGAFAAAVDADNHIWLVDGSTGRVWKGRINRLGWTVGDKVFLE